MSNTSDQTTQQSKTRLIVGEIGVDTETGIIGKGHSYDNGKTFVVDDTIYGRIYHADDHGKIWKGIQDQVAKVVEPAKSAANSAVAYANDAIEKSRVNSQEIEDINSAVSDAKTAFNSDVAEAKNLANAAQTTADSAVKSASSVANDLTAVASQAKANADGITKVTSDVGLLQTTVADNSGNISTIQETAKQIQQAVSDNAGNITVAKQTADSAVTVASDARSNATVAIQTASQASIIASNASGQAASAVITANGAMTTASDAKSNATVAVQTASGASLTATNANSDATVAKQTASEAKVQASNAESDFAQLSIRAGKIEASVANNSGAIASVQQTVDGIQTQVYNSDGTSKITQLSNLIATKVSQGDYNSQITQLNNDINLRVTKGDVISQINQEAGGNTLIQVSNGNGSLVLDAKTTVFTGDAFIPSAAISSISADKIMLGSSALWNSDGTLNLLNQSNGLKALMQVKQGLVQNTTQSIISFASDYNTRAFSITPVGATVTPTLFFERYDQVPDHWLGFTRNDVEHEGVEFNTWDNDGERFFVECHARFYRNISAVGTINQGTWNGTTGKPLAGILTITAGNTIWSGSDFLAIGDHVSNGYTNVIAKSFSQQSTLSSKTNIETVDPKDALDLVNRTDIRSYQYKTDVAEGKTKRYTSLILDDVHDVSQYYAPDEFANEDRTGRDDGSAVGYLFLAVKELTRRIKILEEKLNG